MGLSQGMSPRIGGPGPRHRVLQDYIELLKAHRENDADITIATHSVGWGQASRRGLTRVDPETGAALNCLKILAVVL